MSSLSLRQLALSKALPQGYTHAMDTYDYESADVALLDSMTTGNIESLVDIAAQVDDNAQLVDEYVSVSGGLSDLVDKTMAIHGEGGIDEQGAQLLKISVEAFLKATGLNIPATILVPSFESAKSSADYSTEVIDRKNNMLAKIFSWLYSAMKAIADSIKQFWTKITTSSNGLEAYIKKVKQRVEDVKGTVSDPAEKINLGPSSIWLTDSSERLAKPSNQIVNTVARFEDFVIEWRDKWSPITSLPVPAQHVTSAEVERTSDRIKELALATAKNPAAAKINFVVTHAIELKQGSGEMPLLSATLKIDQLVKGNNHMADVLSKDEMLHGINDAANALKVLTKLQAEVVKVDRITARVNQLSKNVSIKDGENVSVEDMRTALRALAKACSLSSWGWTNTTPYFLKTIKACVSYIDACTHRYSAKRITL